MAPRASATDPSGPCIRITDADVPRPACDVPRVHAGSRTPSGRKPARSVSGPPGVGGVKPSDRRACSSLSGSLHCVGGEDLEDGLAEVPRGRVAASRPLAFDPRTDQHRSQPGLAVAAAGRISGEVPGAGCRLIRQTVGPVRPDGEARGRMVGRADQHELMIRIRRDGPGGRRDRGRRPRRRPDRWSARPPRLPIADLRPRMGKGAPPLHRTANRAEPGRRMGRPGSRPIVGSRISGPSARRSRARLRLPRRDPR